jgi:hypothetical protein
LRIDPTPGPVFIGAGPANGDNWVDAKGMFLATAGAGAVYRLLGKKDMGTTEFPAIESAIIAGEAPSVNMAAGMPKAPTGPRS